MPLSWNEIKDRALAFSREWQHAESEDADAKSFWDAFFNIFGVSRRRVASFERKVKKLDGRDGFIDLLWKGVVLIEHKSRGKDLDRAYQQARGYFPGLKDNELPRYIIVSDFARFRIHDLETDEAFEFALQELHREVKRFAFLAGYQTHVYQDQDPVNIRAAEKMGRLYDQLKAIGYPNHALQVYLVRLLFCLFAEDTGIFERSLFTDYIRERTAEDGSDLAAKLDELFQVLNKPTPARLKNLDEQLNQFPYINGKLFTERIDTAAFDSKMRDALLDCCALDWSPISPAIFGALFQSIMDSTARRNLGAHYTSEKNIQKLIHPLFLDELRAEFEKIKTNKNKLFEFHKKLRSLTFFDPACGCGNFLVITYRELRLLELDVLRAARTSGQLSLDVHGLIQIDVDQFYGIEIEEFPAQIAQVALWLIDHQMNLKVSEEFGLYFARIPLKASANIVHGNALTLDWDSVLPRQRCSHVLGNPPFVGAKYMNDAQRSDTQAVFDGIPSAGLLDFVAAWYVKAARYIALPANGARAIRCAFVSTNSICQGEQVGVLWGWMLQQGIKIHFAHRTFSWRNEARGVAAVHCIIVGFGLQDEPNKTLYDYEDIKGEPHAVAAANINPYLVDASDVVLARRGKPICDVPTIAFGNQPIDGGHLLMTPSEADELRRETPELQPYVRLFLGAEEFINGGERYCLWLKDCPPSVFRKSKLVLDRLNSVRKFRLESKRPATRKLAEVPSTFAFVSHIEAPYIVVPSVSSERRQFVPIGFSSPEMVVSNLCLAVYDATLFHFGILSSTMHNAWVRAVCGRLKSDFRYSAAIVYNNFPWPDAPSDKQRSAIETAAQAVLEARAQFANASLADLYDPLTMPPPLLKAHQALDKCVDAAYGKTKFGSDAERVAFLFERYQALATA
ncbi:class I SAM-dependent DNA methyltransferase [Sinimarinibacterium sp. NLF-5-8]|uniref:class I SAM-dependent DNA methyltransferase n=1 Tax=Sinimarinibacterium sp. NLF-5-8 TaxID=2698684 RepID=UPI00137BE40D|nr:class I SAM-dependent DNA methyltransferase [Sinimarinibacterium sp. NLF-5-8]QHS08799.1 class I SAM-dependent DNA methyltransferase [Sinimarinibacterium sp. NLF-5-8]